MIDESLLEKFQRRLPDAPADEDARALYYDLLEDAQTWVLAYTRRETLPEELAPIVMRLAVIAYNRMGIEGEQSHSEGGTSRTLETIPLDIREALASYRLARTVQ